jgi:hypothetical protein
VGEGKRDGERTKLGVEEAAEYGGRSAVGVSEYTDGESGSSSSLSSPISWYRASSSSASGITCSTLLRLFIGGAHRLPLLRFAALEVALGAVVVVVVVDFLYTRGRWTGRMRGARLREGRKLELVGVVSLEKTGWVGY